MLRMYECIDCKKKHVADDGGYNRCPFCNKGLLSNSMTKNGQGDWVVGDGSKKRNRVVPPIMWH